MAFEDIGTMDTPTDHSEGYTLGEIFSLSLQFSVGVCGIIGNCLVCIVFGFLRSRKSQVNVFLFNQALIDLCTSILLIVYGATHIKRTRIYAASTVQPPPELRTYGKFGGEFLCRFWFSRFILFATFAISSYNLLVMSIERYIAVKKPLNYTKFFNTRNCIVVIALVWIFPPLMQYAPAIFQYMYENGTCTEQQSWDHVDQVIVGALIFVWEYLLPVSIMGYMYFVIANTLRKRRVDVGVSLSRANASSGTPGLTNASPFATTQTTNSPPRRIKSSRNTTQTLFILYAVYILCWTPNQFTFLFYNFKGELNVSSKWYQATVIIAFLNCCINPCIYSMRLKKFQMGVKLLLQCKSRSETIMSMESTASK